MPPILILGETGTGKGLVARLLHQAGPRARGPFVDVNCAAIPASLLEAELFGFERGAFTDARQGKPGLFQAANRGTLFLDEVGLLPEGLQAKILKAIEEREVRRLGSTRSEPVDLWILTATSEDLLAAIRERRFRPDLYHRLAVLTLAMPPLRERGGDIAALVEHFVALFGPALAIPHEAMARLVRHSWPGNVRELRNVIERACVLARDNVLAIDDTFDRVRAESPGTRIDLPFKGAKHELVQAFERDYVRALLERHAGNLSAATREAQLDRKHLRELVRKRKDADEYDRRRDMTYAHATPPRGE